MKGAILSFQVIRQVDDLSICKGADGLSTRPFQESGLISHMLLLRFAPGPEPLWCGQRLPLEDMGQARPVFSATTFCLKCHSRLIRAQGKLCNDLIRHQPALLLLWF